MSIVEQFARRVERSADAEALRSRSGAAWQSLTYREWNEASRRIAAGLVALGVEAGDRVMLLSGSTVEWALADLAIQMVGAISVPVYGTTMADICAYIANDCGCRIALAEDPQQVAKLVAHRAELPRLERVVYFRARMRSDRAKEHDETPLRLGDVVAEGSADAAWLMSLDELQAVGEETLERQAHVLAGRAAALRPETPSAIFYTSGTTGPPKGVLLSQGNFLAAIGALLRALPISEQDVQLLILPLAHILGCVALRSACVAGAAVVFGEGPQKLLDNLTTVRPTYLVAVPRVCEKVYYRILAENAERGAIEQALFQWSVNVGLEWSRCNRAGRPVSRFLALRYRTAEQVVFRRVRALFGGRLRFLLSGGAPLGLPISEFLHAAGVLVLEGYGLTETTAAGHVNRPHRFRLGTVGQPVEGMECRIGLEGEILLRGPTVMQGYYGRPDDTAAVLDPEGWLHTGDVGSLDDDGFLSITDRIRDIIVLAGGANVSPGNIESLLRASPYVSHVVVCGDGRPFLSALITLDEDSVRQFAADRRLAVASFSELCQHPDVYALVEETVEEQNARLPPHERIRKFAILDYDFSAEGGELTPTHKTRRQHTIDKHRSLFESFYRDRF